MSGENEVYRRTKKILNRDRQQLADAAHKRILDVVTEEGPDNADEKIAKMKSLADIAYRLLNRTKILSRKPKK